MLWCAVVNAWALRDVQDQFDDGFSVVGLGLTCISPDRLSLVRLKEQSPISSGASLHANTKWTYFKIQLPCL
jgi:hypothetical protein